MLGGVVVLGAVSEGFVHAWRTVLEQSLRAATTAGEVSDAGWAMAMRRMMKPAVMPVAMVMAASFAGALGVGIGAGWWC